MGFPKLVRWYLYTQYWSRARRAIRHHNKPSFETIFSYIKFITLNRLWLFQTCPKFMTRHFCQYCDTYISEFHSFHSHNFTDTMLKYYSLFDIVHVTHWGLSKLLFNFVDNIFKHTNFTNKILTLMRNSEPGSHQNRWKIVNDWSIHPDLWDMDSTLISKWIWTEHLPLFLKLRVTQDGGSDTSSVDGRVGVHGTNEDLDLRQDTSGLVLVTAHHSEGTRTLTWGRQQVEINSLWPGDAVWWERSVSTLVHVMACCLMAPSHYLNQYWLVIKVFCGIHLRAISQEVLIDFIHIMCLEITLKKLLPYPPGANELTHWGHPFADHIFK